MSILFHKPRIHDKATYVTFFIAILSSSLTFVSKNFILLGIISAVLFSILSITAKLLNGFPIKAYYLLLLWIFVLTSSLIVAILHGNDNIYGVLKYYLVLTILPISFYGIGQSSLAFKALIYATLPSSLLIICISIIFSLHPDLLILRPILWERGIGDIYTHNGYLYIVQLTGSQFSFISLLLTLSNFRGLKRIIYASIFGAAVIISGNFSFILGIIVYFVFTFLFRSSYPDSTCPAPLPIFSRSRLVICLFILLFASPVLLAKLSSILALKQDASLPIRLDQITLLLDRLFQNPFFGCGLGMPLSILKSNLVDYSNHSHVELMFIYIIAQIGIPSFLLFGYTCYFLYQSSIFLTPYTKHAQSVLLLSAIIGLSFNPYFFDSNSYLIITSLVHSNSGRNPAKHILNY